MISVDILNHPHKLWKTLLIPKHEMNLHPENENQIPSNLKAGLSSTNLRADLGGPFILPKIQGQDLGFFLFI